jgi:phosphoserine phosphatase
MAKGLRLTKNCRNALKVLRSQGMVTALISGGINVFLEEAFPDFRNYFDFVFINELVFSSFGMISGVKATAYDFEGKADALALVCGLAGVTAEQSVFVGDHYNDKTVMSYAKKAIAYPANDAVPDDVSHATVKENDLMAVLPHILVK